MQNILPVNSNQGSEQALEVESHVGDSHISKVISEILVLEVWKNGNDLIMMSKRSNERTDTIGIFQVVQYFELIQDTDWATRYVDFLYGNVTRLIAVSVP